MRKNFSILLFAGLLLTGCTSEPVTQHDCLEQGEFRYDGECVQYKDIPETERKDVWIEIADEIAEARGITRGEALFEIMSMMEDYQY